MWSSGRASASGHRPSTGSNLGGFSGTDAVVGAKSRQSRRGAGVLTSTDLHNELRAFAEDPLRQALQELRDDVRQGVREEIQRALTNLPFALSADARNDLLAGRPPSLRQSTGSMFGGADVHQTSSFQQELHLVSNGDKGKKHFWTKRHMRGGWRAAQAEAREVNPADSICVSDAADTTHEPRGRNSITSRRFSQFSTSCGSLSPGGDHSRASHHGGRASIVHGGRASVVHGGRASVSGAYAAAAEPLVTASAAAAAATATGGAVDGGSGATAGGGGGGGSGGCATEGGGGELDGAAIDAGGAESCRSLVVARVKPSARTERPKSLVEDSDGGDEEDHLLDRGNAAKGDEEDEDDDGVALPRAQYRARFLSYKQKPQLKAASHIPGEFKDLKFCRRALAYIVTSDLFERAACVLVLMSAALVGIETNYQAVHDPSDRLDWCFSRGETAFCVLFTLELFLRVCVHRRRFFRTDVWLWNVFDSVCVGLQLFDQGMMLFGRDLIREAGIDLQDVRVLKVVRIVRVIRAVRLSEELRQIASSIWASIATLLWTLVLLLMTIYIFSVVITQLVADTSPEVETYPKLQYWYGTLGRTILTMFEAIVGGATWDEVVVPLIKDISPLMGVAFCGYITFCVFAMMNVVTAAFVEKATRTAQENRDISLANHISSLFCQEDSMGQQVPVTYEDFSEKLDTAGMREYFKALNLDPSEARGFFDLLDVDASGSVDPEEIVDGCLRLRGNAKALELSLLMHEILRMDERVCTFQMRTEDHLQWIEELLGAGE